MSQFARRISAFLQQHPNGPFWIAFAILNGLVFLPMAWIAKEEASLPLFSIAQNGWSEVMRHLLVWRETADPWRLSAELTLMVALWVWFSSLRRRWVGVAFGLIYGLILLYAVYEAVVVGIYLLEPSFYAQFFLARDALPSLLEHLQATATLYLSGSLLLGGTFALVLALWRLLLWCGARPRFSCLSRSLLTALAVWTLSVISFQQQHSAQPEAVVSSFAFKLWENYRTSKTLYQRIQKLDAPQQGLVYDYRAFPLAQKPDIYLIFVEAYGSVLYQRADFNTSYRDLLRELSAQLQENGWKMVTALSEAPTWGGGSWLSYTTTLFGMHIDQHPQYLELREKYQTERYPSLGVTLHDQGYHYVWLSTLQENYSEEVWEKYTRLLAVDELIRYRDLGYIGPRYGWGPSPPDQWTLHWVHEVLKDKVKQPLFLFTITQNSHYPFAPLPPLAEDWRTLNQPGRDPEAVDPQTIRLATMRANYLQAVEYELRMLTQWILEVGDPNSIFILIGDHQPAGVSRRADGYATPLHILSQDEALIRAFTEYGFVFGLEVTDLQPSLRHEGFYSLFMRILFGRYGIHQLAQPVYLPNGIQLESNETIN